MSTVIESHSPAITPANGRPKSLDAEAKKGICALIAQGFSLKQAATYFACHRDTIRNERRRDPHFDANLRRALEMADIQPLDLIHRAAKTSWRAAAWLVEFRRRVKKEVREAREARKQKAASSQMHAIAPAECESDGEPTNEYENDRETFSPSPLDSLAAAPVAAADSSAESIAFPELTSQESPAAERPFFGLEAKKPSGETGVGQIANFAAITEAEFARRTSKPW